MKRILLVYFSQTGQLKSVAESFIQPILKSKNIIVDVEELRPISPYPFPWPFSKFFDQFPEAVSLTCPPLQPFKFDQSTKYDLIILAYTVWYLSPSPPITAFLKSTEGKTVLRDNPVITLIACRNMWLQAQEQVKQLLAQADAYLLDNVVLTDKGSPLISLVTTPRWMLTGKRDAFFKFFPRAGLTDEDIAATERFGKALLPALMLSAIDKHAPLLKGLKAVSVDQRLIDTEKIARRSFIIWGKIFRVLGPQGHPRRKFAAIAYGLFLCFIIATVVPTLIGLRILLKPWRRNHFAEQCQYFEEPSGSGNDRLGEYT